MERKEQENAISKRQDTPKKQEHTPEKTGTYTRKNRNIQGAFFALIVEKS
jgi:hypothetical protein